MASDIAGVVRTVVARFGGSTDAIDRLESAVRELVRAETSRAIRAMGLATTAEVERLSAQVADLKRALADATPTAPGRSATERAPTARPPAKRSPAGASAKASGAPAGGSRPGRRPGAPSAPGASGSSAAGSATPGSGA